MPPVVAGLAMITTAAVGAAVAPAVFVATGLSQMLFFAGASVIMGGISRSLLKKPKASGLLSDVQSRSVSVRQSAPPWDIVYGRTRKGGVFSFLGTTGASNEYFHMVLTLTGHEVSEIGTMYFGAEAVPLDAQGNATGKYAGHVHVEKNLGTADQEAFPGLVAATTKWTENHRQRGRAGVYIRVKWNPDLFPDGLPNITFDVKGKPVYDPRTGQTAYSENNALCTRDYLTDTEYGMRIPASKIDDDCVITAANICDENVWLQTGTTEKRYICNGSFQASASRPEILKALLANMAGELVPTAGKICLYAGAYRDPTMVLTDDDIIGPIQVTGNVNRRELFNAVRGLFVSPENNWEPDDFPAVTNAQYESEDGGRLWQDVEFPFEIRSTGAQRLAKQLLEDIRRQKTVRFPAKLLALRLQPPATVYFTHSRFGWNQKIFKVAEARLIGEPDENNAPTLAVDLTLREHDSGVYEWWREEQEDPPPPSVDFPDMSSVQPPTNLQLAEISVVRVDGARITMIEATWTAPADEFVVNGGRIEIEWKLNTASDFTSAAPSAGNITRREVGPVEDGKTYVLQIRSVNSIGATSVWVADSIAIVGTSANFTGQISGRDAAEVDDASGRALAAIDEGGYINPGSLPLFGSAPGAELATTSLPSDPADGNLVKWVTGGKLGDGGPGGGGGGADGADLSPKRWGLVLPYSTGGSATVGDYLWGFGQSIQYFYPDGTYKLLNLRLLTQTTLNSGHAIRGAPNWRAGQDPDAKFAFQLVTTGPEQRTWVGLMGADLNEYVTDDPTSIYAAFRFSTSAGDTTWRAITKDGSNINNLDTGLAPNTDPHIFQIVQDDAGGKVLFYIDGALVATSSQYIPPTTSLFRAYMGIINLLAGSFAKQLRFYWWYIQVKNDPFLGS